MKISATVFVILISTCIVNASVLDPVIENVVHLKASKPPSGVAGIWKKKTIWKPRWVKEWKSAKVMKPVWKKVWSPVQIREWVPIPKPPPGWDSLSTPLSSLHPRPQKTSIKESTGHNSVAVQASTKIPLWDPIPYPESQQPPPPPPLHNTHYPPSDSSHSGTFNHQQISEIIGPQYGGAEYYQNTEYSETVNHLTRLPPDGSSWRPPFPDSQADNRFGSFPVVPEFLVPPVFRPLSENFRPQDSPNQQQFFGNMAIPPPSAFEPQNGLRQWTPFPPEMMKIKGHLVTKPADQPYKFQFPEMERHTKSRTETTRGENESKEKVNFQTDGPDFRLQADGDVVQEAHLVGEYHYSDFDLPKLNHESNKPQPSREEKDQVKVKPQEKPKPVTEVPKHKPIHDPPGENKQTQNRTETRLEIHHLQNSQHVQKKHVIHPPWNASNANQIHHHQKGVLKEILPNYNSPQITNETLISQNLRFASMSDHEHKKHLPMNLPSTLLLAVEPESRFNSTNVSNLHQRGHYPIYETPQIQAKIPPDHRFSLPLSSTMKSGDSAKNSGTQRQKHYPVYEFPRNPNNHRFSSPTASNFTNATNLNYKENYPVYEIPEISTPDSNSKHKLLQDSQFQDDSPDRYTVKSPPVAANRTEKTGKPLLERNASVQLVFPAIDEVSSEATAKSKKQKLTTTEPYSAIFSSSLFSKTEAATKSPVVIVTPIVQNKS